MTIDALIEAMMRYSGIVKLVFPTEELLKKAEIDQGVVGRVSVSLKKDQLEFLYFVENTLTKTSLIIGLPVLDKDKKLFLPRLREACVDKACYSDLDWPSFLDEPLTET